MSVEVQQNVLLTVLSVGMRILEHLANETQKVSADFLTSSLQDTLSFEVSIQNLASTSITQFLRLTIVAIQEVDLQLNQLIGESSIVRSPELHTLPRIPTVDTFDALFGGATALYDSNSGADAFLSFLDFIFLLLFWARYGISLHFDYIESFFAIFACFSSFYLVLHWVFNLLLLLDVKAEAPLVVAYVFSQATVWYISIASVVLLLFALATRLNRRPAYTAPFTFFGITALLSLCMGALSVGEFPRRSLFFGTIFVEMLAISFSSFALFFVLLMSACKEARFSRFEKDVTVLHAKKNLCFVLITQIVMTLLLYIDIAVKMYVMTLSGLVEFMQCFFHIHLPNSSYPCSTIAFLVDSGAILRPSCILLVAFFIPSIGSTMRCSDENGGMMETSDEAIVSGPNKNAISQTLAGQEIDSST